MGQSRHNVYDFFFTSGFATSRACSTKSRATETAFIGGAPFGSLIGRRFAPKLCVVIRIPGLARPASRHAGVSKRCSSIWCRRSLVMEDAVLPSPQTADAACSTSSTTASACEIMTACEAPSIVTVFFDPARSAKMPAGNGNAVVARSEDEPRRDGFPGGNIGRLRHGAFRKRALCQGQQLRFCFREVSRILEPELLRLKVQVPAAVREQNGGRCVRLDGVPGKRRNSVATLSPVSGAKAAT